MGIGSVVVKAAGIDGTALAFHRVWLAGLIYSIVLVAAGGRITIAHLRVAAPGGLAFGVQVALFYSAIQLTTVANATMIMALYPVLVLAFFSARFGEAVSGLDWTLTLVAIAGIALVVFGSVGSPAWSPVGDLLAVVSLIAWARYFAVSKRARLTLGAVEYQAQLLLVGSLFLLPLVLIFGESLNPGIRGWPWIVAMVAIPGTGHLLLNWAHPRVPLSIVSQMTLISPVVSVVVAAIALEGETVNIIQMVGMAVVLGALGQLVRQRRPTATGDSHDQNRTEQTDGDRPRQVGRISARRR